MFKFARQQPELRCNVEQAAMSMIADGTVLLPILPEFAGPLRAALAGSGTDIDTDVRLITSEPALAVAVLMYANAGARMPWSRTADLPRILARIGPDTLPAILQELLARHTWQPDTPEALALLRTSRADSLRVAHAAGHLAGHFGQVPATAAHLAGLMHRAGTSVLIVAADRARGGGQLMPDLPALLRERQDAVSHALLDAARLPRTMARLPLQYNSDSRSERVQLADLVAAARSLTSDVSEPIQFEHVRPLDKLGIARTDIGLQRRQVSEVLTALAA